MRRRWWVLLLAGFLGLQVADTWGSAYVLSEMVAHPVTELARGEGDRAERFAIAAGGLPLPGMGASIGGSGIWLGYSTRFLLPDGRVVECRQRLDWYGCLDGWQALRAGVPAG